MLAKPILEVTLPNGKRSLSSMVAGMKVLYLGLLIIFTAISIASASLWVRSYIAADELRYQRLLESTPQQIRHLRFSGGTFDDRSAFEFEIVHVRKLKFPSPESPPGLRLRERWAVQRRAQLMQSQADAAFGQLQAMLMQKPLTRWVSTPASKLPSVVGSEPAWRFSNRSSNDPMMSVWRLEVRFPLWASFVASAGIWLLLWKLWRRSRRVAPNCCPKCGYDLRATPDRCPECGTPMALEKDAAFVDSNKISRSKAHICGAGS